MSKTIKVDEAVHNYLLAMQKETNCSLSQLINYASVSFKGTKDYAMLVLYNQEPKKIKE